MSTRAKVALRLGTTHVGFLAVLALSVPLVRATPRPQLTDEGSFVILQERKEAAPLLRNLNGFAKRFAKITGLDGGSAPPVVISIPKGKGNGVAADPRVDALEGGLPRISFTLSGNMPGDVDFPGLSAALLLREHYGTNAPAPGSRVPTYPAWLLRGLGRLCSRETDPDGVSFAGHPAPSLEDFLARRSLPVGNLALCDLHDRMAAFLVLAGLGESPKGFRDWIGHAEGGNGTAPPPWPWPWDMRSVEKRWNLMMSSSSAGKDPGSRIPDAVRSLADFDRCVGGDSFAALRDPKSLGDFGRDRLLESLSALSLQANPLVLPLIDRTSALLRSFPKISRKRLDKALSELVAERSRTGNHASEISSYLDWYEAARLESWSGLFDGVLGNNSIDSVKKGPVGAYLDKIEARGW